MNSAPSAFSFEQAVAGLLAGDFSRLEPLFTPAPGETPCPIIDWHKQHLFANHPEALAEAFTCACFNGSLPVVQYFLANNLDPSGGARTGLNAFHWAANRGQKNIVELLIHAGAPLETQDHYGGTVLGCAVWSAVHEAKPDHLEIIKLLLAAGSDPLVCDYPSSRADIDEVIAAARTNTDKK